MRQRNPSIDILKFFAALLITNSHMGLLYPDSLAKFSTGGAIGDVLFFFCSGFTVEAGISLTGIKGVSTVFILRC